jgi:hypothetical protein
MAGPFDLRATWRPDTVVNDANEMRRPCSPRRRKQLGLELKAERRRASSHGRLGVQ